MAKASFYGAYGDKYYNEYLLGHMSRSESEKRKREERIRYRNETSNENIKMIMGCLLCCPCAEFCFNEKNGGKESFAASLSCMVYGTLTTVLSSGVCDVHGVPKSSTGLGCGITGLVLGTCCSLGLCAFRHYEKQELIKVNADSTPAYTIPNVHTTQPQSNT